MVSEHGVVPVSSECQHLFPAKIVSRLVKWAAIPYEDYAVGAECEAISLPFPAQRWQLLTLVSPRRSSLTLKM